MALPHGTTGSLRPTFVSARPICLAVKHPYTFALYMLITNHIEGTIALLRYSLGGDRPSQTAHLNTVPMALIHGHQVRLLNTPRVVFHRWLHSNTSAPTSTPPTYATHNEPEPISGYSKGSRGLSVLVRERGIFTTTTISPSPSLRQCGSRYAIRAGRNLPDKELRYLRTVIVTAAIHRGFDSQLRLAANHSS